MKGNPIFNGGRVKAAECLTEGQRRKLWLLVRHHGPRTTSNLLGCSLSVVEELGEYGGGVKPSAALRVAAALDAMTEVKP